MTSRHARTIADPEQRRRYIQTIPNDYHHRSMAMRDFARTIADPGQRRRYIQTIPHDGWRSMAMRDFAETIADPGQRRRYIQTIPHDVERSTAMINFAGTIADPGQRRRYIQTIPHNYSRSIMMIEFARTIADPGQRRRYIQTIPIDEFRLEAIRQLPSSLPPPNPSDSQSGQGGGGGQAVARPAPPTVQQKIQYLQDRLSQRQRQQCARLFQCPITLRIMIDPVVAEDGHSYERATIQRWLRLHGTSPLTNETMGTRLTPNIHLRTMIRDKLDEWFTTYKAREQDAITPPPNPGRPPLRNQERESYSKGRLSSTAPIVRGERAADGKQQSSDTDSQQQQQHFRYF